MRDDGSDGWDGGPSGRPRERTPGGTATHPGRWPPPRREDDRFELPLDRRTADQRAGGRAVPARTAPARTAPARIAPARIAPARTAPAPSRTRGRLARRIRIGVALLAALVLGTCGLAWGLYRDLTAGITTTDVISGGWGAVGQNILLVGVDSRTDAQGNPLPAAILSQLHSGPDTGVVNSDTIMLLHVPAGGGAAVAFSIPRDSYVRIPGHGRDKINAAYPRVQATTAERLVAEGVDDPGQVQTRSAEAGRRALVEAVQELTGRTIDHYAELNLAGFYSLTGASVPEAVQRMSELRGCDLLFSIERGEPQAFANWRDALEPRAQHVMESERLEESAARTARRLAGRSVGVVLSGGGARALAHIGALAELLDAGVQIDRVGGCDTGAFIGAMFAMGMEPAEIDARCYEEWVRRSPLSDYRIPRTSLIAASACARCSSATFPARSRSCRASSSVSPAIS